MALKNFTQFTPQTVLSATDFVVGYRNVDEIRTDLDSLTVAISGLLIAKGFTPGGSVGTVKRINYRYTIDGGENLNAVSGMDDYGNYLSYTTGQLDVYRNGVHLVDNQDFIANNNTQIRNLSTMNEGDVVDVVTLSATGVTITSLLSGGGTVFQTNYRYTCPTKVAIGTINISGPDDSGNTLLYSSPTLDVYLNGSHLVNGLDYSASNGSTITLSEGLSSGDILDVATLSAYDIGGLGGVSRIVAGPGIILNPSSGLGEVTITGNTLQLTGGNINIPVGSTRQFTKLQSALDSLSSFIFDDTADVQILLDDETFNETSPIDLSHDYGDRITVRGANTYPFRTVQQNCVLNVSGSNIPALSATIQFNSSLNIPSVGDYVTVTNISGRDAGFATFGQDCDNYTIFAIPSSNPNLIRPGTYTKIRTGDWALITKLSPFAAGPITSAAIPITAVDARTFSGIGWTSVSLSATSFVLGTDIRYVMTQFGTADSNIGNKFTQTLHPDGNRAILIFNDAVNTDTYLNEGDFVHALGQFTFVQQTSSANRCIVFPPLYTNGAGNSGRSSTISTATPYLVKTAFERYNGCHKVVAVAGNNVTIEMMSYGHITPSMVSLGTSVHVISGQRLPIYGVNNFGYDISDRYNNVSKIAGLSCFIHKTKLNFTSAAASLTGNSAFVLDNAQLNYFDNVVVVNDSANTIARLFNIGSSKSSQMTLGNSFAVWGNFEQAILLGNKSNLNMGNFYATQVIRNYNNWNLSAPVLGYFVQSQKFYISSSSSCTISNNGVLALRAYSPHIATDDTSSFIFTGLYLTDCIAPVVNYITARNGCILFGFDWENGLEKGEYFATIRNSVINFTTIFNKNTVGNSWGMTQISNNYRCNCVYAGPGRNNTGDLICSESQLRFGTMYQTGIGVVSFGASILQIDESIYIETTFGTFFAGGTGGFGYRVNWIAFCGTFVKPGAGSDGTNMSFFSNTQFVHCNLLYDTTNILNYRNTSINFSNALLLNSTLRASPNTPSTGITILDGNAYFPIVYQL